MKPIFSEWKSATNDLPTKDGDYVVIKMCKNKWTNKKEMSYGSSIFYFVEHGWNVHRHSDGSWYTGAQILFEDEPDAFWAEVTEEEE